MEKIETNPQNERVLALVRQGKNVLVTGGAGTGKSTLLKLVRNECRHKGVLTMAPTGMAALNVGGATIHSTLRIAPRALQPEDLEDWYGSKFRAVEQADVVIIDEISMVRADLLELVDARLRMVGDAAAPFGGKQVVLFGDPFQLPPVVREASVKAFLTQRHGGELFFDSKSYKEGGFSPVVLLKTYRQHDQTFIDLLNDIRLGENLGRTLHELNRHVGDKLESSVVLASTNSVADGINKYELGKLPGDPKGWIASIDGDFPENIYPTEMLLALKEGAQVMVLKNDSTAHEYVNGTLGVVSGQGSSSVSMQITDAVDEDCEGLIVSLQKETWENCKMEIVNKRLTAVPVGTFTQIPLRLAWAITIHKSQGQSMDKVHVDLGSGSFASGQSYVALSRCRTLDGLTLARPLTEADIRVDERVIDFYKSVL